MSEVYLHLGTHDNEHSDFSDVEQEIEIILAEGKDVLVLIEDAEGELWQSKYLEFSSSLENWDYDASIVEISLLKNIPISMQDLKEKYNAFREVTTPENFFLLRKSLLANLNGQKPDSPKFNNDFDKNEHEMLVRLVEDYGKRIKVFKEFVDTPKEGKPHPKVIWHWSNGRRELAEKGYWDYITKSVRIIQVRDETIAEYLGELLESNGNRSFIVIFGTLHKNIANYLKDIRNIEVKIIIRNKGALESNASNRLLARLLEMGDISKHDFRSDPDFNFLFEEYIRQNPKQEEQ